MKKIYLDNAATTPLREEVIQTMINVLQNDFGNPSSTHSFGRSAKTQQAKIALDQAKTQLTQTEQQLKLEYERAKSEYEFSIEEYATSKSNLNLAERIERKQQIKAITKLIV